MNRSRRVAFAVVSGLVLMVASSIPALADPGDVDETFASLGLLTQAHAGVGREVLLTPGPEGRFVLAWAASNEIGISGFFGNGSPDANFGSGGSSTIAVAGADAASVYDSAVDAQGRTVLVGWAEYPSAVRMVVARFTPEGDPDAAFSDDGLRTISFNRGEAYGYGVALRGGKIYLCGQVYTGTSDPADPAVVRLDGAGALDPGFGFGGKRLYKVPDGFAGDDWALRMVSVADGRLVLAGGVGSAQSFNSLVMRIHGDGRLDRTFKGDGYHIMNLRKGMGDDVEALELDGKKLALGIGGPEDSNPKIVRLRPDGSKDTTFSGDGVGTYPFGSLLFRLSDIAIDAKHRVYVTGFQKPLPVFRVRADGSLATGFGVDGLTTNPATLADGWDVMLRGGLVIVAGYTGTGTINATRYLP